MKWVGQKVHCQATKQGTQEVWEKHVLDKEETFKQGWFSKINNPHGGIRDQTKGIRGGVIGLVFGVRGFANTSVLSSVVSGCPPTAGTTPIELGTLNDFLIHRLAILVRHRLHGVIGGNESGILAFVLLGRATLLDVTRTLLLLGLGAVLGDVSRLITVEASSGFL
jgi:hypothetical protein